MFGVLLADDAHQPPEFGVLGRRATFLLQKFKRNRPFVLFAAMLAPELINAPFKRLSQPEIIPVQGQNLAAQHRVEHPVGQVDRDF